MQPSPSRRKVPLGAILVIAALVGGVVLGLLISRGIKPPRLSNKAFANLGVNPKEDYIVLVGAAYSLDRDLERAQERLDRLEAPNIQQWVAHLLERYLAEERDQGDIRGLVDLAHGLGVHSPSVLAYLANLTPLPTDTPFPSPTPAPTNTSTSTPAPATEVPTAVPATATPQPQPTDTPQPLPTATPLPSPTTAPANTSPPPPTNTPKPTSTPAAKWAWSARLVGPGQEGQSCAEGHKLIRVTVLNAAGSQISGVWIYEQYTGQYRVSGHKGDDPYWGPGEAEFSGLDGGQVCVATGDGGPCESEVTRNLPCHDPPEFEDLWAAGYCECCEPAITKERCRELFDGGRCLGISHYAWRVEFKRSW
jgi:hypothetical protein